MYEFHGGSDFRLHDDPGIKLSSLGRCLMFVLSWVHYGILSYDVASGSEITPCNKIDKPLVVYTFTGNGMTSITTLRT